MHVQVRGRRRAAVGAASGRAQVQRVLGSGDDPHRPCPAHIDGVGVTEGGELGGDAGTVSSNRRASGVSRVMITSVVAGLPVWLTQTPRRASSSSSSATARSGSKYEPRLLDQPRRRRPGGSSPVSHDQPVRERDCFGGEVVGLPGDRAGSPDRHRPAIDEVQSPGSGRSAPGRRRSAGGRRPG